ncbi:MAG: HNH endonuclease [Candidatus Limnocylindrales bacterium]
MKGCLGCLGALVVFGLLAWPIEEVGQFFGWSDAQTGYVLLLVLGLLAVGASRQRRAGRRLAPQTTKPRMRPHSVPCEAPAVRLRESRTTRARHVGRMGHPLGLRMARDHLAQDRAPGSPSERGSQPRRDTPATWSSTPLGLGAGRARDPLPAQLRFRVLQRDGFRCRYCGRPGSAPGVVLHVDHIVPLAAGGVTRENNLRTACEECNLGKSTRALVPTALPDGRGASVPSRKTGGSAPGGVTF